jgi:hypothetical protein
MQGVAIRIAWSDDFCDCMEIEARRLKRAIDGARGPDDFAVTI